MPTLLCVDDEPDHLMIRKLFLEAQGYQVRTAISGQECLNALAQAPCDVLVLDYNMPDMNGLDLARRLRAETPSIRILLLSGYSAGLPPEIHSLVDAEVTKGSSASDLLERLRELTGGPSERRPPQSVDQLIRASEEQAERSRKVVEEGKRHSRAIRAAGKRTSR